MFVADFSYQPFDTERPGDCARSKRDDNRKLGAGQEEAHEEAYGEVEENIERKHLLPPMQLLNL